MTQGPTGSSLLDLYAQGVEADPAGRAALLCAAGGGDASTLSIGDVDRTIWDWLRTTFAGPQQAVINCVTCGENIEFTLPDEFTLPARSADAQRLKVAFGGKDYTLRLPRLEDIQGGTLARDALCEQAPWNDPEFETIAQSALLEADPGLQVELKLECATCETLQVRMLNVAGFAWARLEQIARRVVQEVAKLARAFGWSEAELTSMTSARRAIWLAEIGE